MTTPRITARVSLVATLALSLMLGACASAGTPAPGTPLAATEASPATIRFSNEATYYVRVYLVSERRQWLLGRVEAGSSSTLRIPAEALDEDTAQVRIAVLPGQLGLVNQASLARVTTFMQPVQQIVAKKWAFAPRLDGGQLNWVPLANR